MNYQGKVWGDTQQIFGKNNVQIHVVNIKAGGYCSKHKHLAKYNAFYVLRGCLDIEVWKNDYDLVDRTILPVGRLMIVQPGEYHRFHARTDVQALEIYWTELSDNDIVREDVDGVDGLPQAQRREHLGEGRI